MKPFSKSLLTFDVERYILGSGGEKVTSVKDVFITREVADKLNLTPTYLIKLAKKLNLNEDEMREAGNRNYLFSKDAVAKLEMRNKK